MASEVDMKVAYQSPNNPLTTTDDSIAVGVVSDKNGESRPTVKQGVSSSRKSSIFRCPRLFERAAQRWWSPRFDSREIEEQYQRLLIPELKNRFRYALCFIILMSLTWVIYTSVVKPSDWTVLLSTSLVSCITAIVFWFYTMTEHYKSHVQLSSVFVSLILYILTMVLFIFSDHDEAFITRSISTFAMCLEIILMMYTVLPMPLYVCAPLGLVFSIVYEIFFFIYANDYYYNYSVVIFTKELFTKVFLHFCVHLIGFHIFFMSQVRSHSTFWKIAQATLTRHEFALEKQNTETMIHSVMPKYLAGEIMTVGTPTKRQTAFSEFFMMRMEPVSILFADIVGFTRMSGKKTADVLVDLLNDLFGRFDKLCEVHGCEKISTLGDCYYCVSGCPVPRDDHAQCCVEMGLSMIDAIKDFCSDRNENVDMRVGIHTGMVLCGIIGKKRFKFDVWSDSVNTANQMEGAGKKGMVHISAKTAEYLKDLSQYELTDGDGDTRNKGILGFKTHFIEKKKDRSGPAATNSEKALPGSDNSGENGSNTNGGESTGVSNAKVHQISSNQVPKSSPVWMPRVLSRKATHQHSQVQNNPESAQPLLQVPAHSENGGVSSTDPGGAVTVEEIIGEDVSLKSNLKEKDIEDQRLISYMKLVKEENSGYLQSAPINICMLSFLQDDVEKMYRLQFKPQTLRDTQLASKETQLEAQPRPSGRRLSSETISTTKYNTLFDVGVGFLVYLFISIGCFLVFDVHIPWGIMFAIGSLLQLFVFTIVLQEAFFSLSRTRCHLRIISFFHSWYPRHILGVVLVSLPSMAVYANIRCTNEDFMSKPFYWFMITVALLHYCNFVQLSSWTKTAIALLSGVVILIISNIEQCNYNEDCLATTNNQTVNDTQYWTDPPEDMESYTSCSMSELIVVILLLVLLIFILNHQFEISFRLNFYGGVQAADDKAKIQEQKNKAEELLHNIVPKFVYESFQETASSKYSKNHQDVGIIFGSIINFNEFYSEIFADGIECIRILNEMISDFDSLLEMEKFRDVEKIKTIGSTYMAACGLHFSKPEHERSFKYDHLETLMEFAIEMQESVKCFNHDSLSMTMGTFEFILRIGFHHGSINSGVIGTTKLFYDIWGDAVNIASRMDSTGVAKKIQVAHETVQELNHLYDFEYRGEITVKGKQAPMHTFFVLGRLPNPLPAPVPLELPPTAK